MLKLMGAAAVILAAGSLGIRKYNELCERRRILVAIRSGAQSIYNNIECMCMPLDECFLTGGELFSDSAEFMRKGALPCDAVKNAADRMRVLTKEDKACIHRFAEGLCAQNSHGQIRNLKLFQSELERCIESSSKEIETKGKLFVKGSFLGGAAVALLLF